MAERVSVKLEVGITLPETHPVVKQVAAAEAQEEWAKFKDELKKLTKDDLLNALQTGEYVQVLEAETV